MNLEDFGKNIQLIRGEILQLTQTQFAEAVSSTQVLISRLERGVGGEIKIVFVILNYLRKKGFPTQIIFQEPFLLKQFVRKKTKPGENFGLKEFGKRVKRLREEVFGISQEEYAKELGQLGAMVSRLETGIGGNIHILFQIINSVNKRNLDGSLLFADEFNIHELKKVGKKRAISEEDVAWMLKDLQRSFNERIEKLLANYS